MGETSQRLHQIQRFSRQARVVPAMITGNQQNPIDSAVKFTLQVGQQGSRRLLAAQVLANLDADGYMAASHHDLLQVLHQLGCWRITSQQQPTHCIWHGFRGRCCWRFGKQQVGSCGATLACRLTTHFNLIETEGFEFGLPGLRGCQTAGSPDQIGGKIGMALGQDEQPTIGKAGLGPEQHRTVIGNTGQGMPEDHYVVAGRQRTFRLEGRRRALQFGNADPLVVLIFMAQMVAGLCVAVSQHVIDSIGRDSTAKLPGYLAQACSNFQHAQATVGWQTPGQCLK